MWRKAKATDRPFILTAHSGKAHQEKFRALSQAGYAELGSEPRRLNREFYRLDAESLKYLDWPEAH